MKGGSQQVCILCFSKIGTAKLEINEGVTFYISRMFSNESDSVQGHKDVDAVCVCGMQIR